MLRVILETLLSDAVDTDDAEVLVTATETGPEVHIIVEDGDLSDEIEAKTESGLAIEIAELACEHAGGDLTVTDEPDWSRLVLHLPEETSETTPDQPVFVTREGAKQ